MTTLRQPYYELSPAVYNALVQAKTALENSTLDTTFLRHNLKSLLRQRLLNPLPTLSIMLTHFLQMPPEMPLAKKVCQCVLP